MKTIQGNKCETNKFKNIIFNCCDFEFAIYNRNHADYFNDRKYFDREHSKYDSDKHYNVIYTNLILTFLQRIL